jgi:putative ABC transport system permease protein
LAVGDELTVGDVRFALRGVIEREPDRVMEFFSLGPGSWSPSRPFDQTGLTQPGSLFRIEYLLRL